MKAAKTALKASATEGFMASRQGSALPSREKASPLTPLGAEDRSVLSSPVAGAETNCCGEEQIEDPELPEDESEDDDEVGDEAEGEGLLVFSRELSSGFKSFAEERTVRGMFWWSAGGPGWSEDAASPPPKGVGFGG